MSFTYNLGNNIGKTRLWIADTDSSQYVFEDEEISSILSQNDNEVRAAAAGLLLILANSKALLAKKKQAGKYSEDTTQIARELRAQAKAILEGGVVPWEAVGEQTFGPVDRPFDGAGEREFIDREALRDEL